MFYINYLINKGEVSCIQVILLACLMIRRLKKDVLHQLPNKQRWGSYHVYKLYYLLVLWLED